MIEYYPQAKLEGLKDIPKKIQEATDSFLKESNFYMKWMEETFIQSPNEKVSFYQSYLEFEKFYKYLFPNRKSVPDLCTYRYFMSKILGTPNNGYWNGFICVPFFGGKATKSAM